MRTILQFTVSILMISLCASCASTEKLLDQGNYDALIDLAHRKLAGKKNKKEKYVRALETGFAKAVERDMERINRLKASDDADDWEKIIDLADRIERRQDRLEPYLPLIAKEGYQADFTFVKTDEIAQYAEGKVIQTLYDEGVAYMESARGGNKYSAQRAYRAFRKIEDYVDFYRDTESLKNEARDLGVVHVTIKIENAAREWMPSYVAAALVEPFYIEDRFWTQYHFDGEENEIEADYEAQLIVTDVVVGPESIHDEEIERTVEIEDGFQYVLDENGNVAKDTLGNDIKEIKYATVRGVVVRTHQEKIAHVRGRVKVKDLHKNVVVDSRPIDAEARFYHMGRSHYGDERALDKKDRTYIGLAPFPSNEELILQAAEALKPLFIKEIERKKYI